MLFFFVDCTVWEGGFHRWMDGMAGFLGTGGMAGLTYIGFDYYILLAGFWHRWVGLDPGLASSLRGKREQRECRQRQGMPVHTIHSHGRTLCSRLVSESNIQVQVAFGSLSRGVCWTGCVWGDQWPLSTKYGVFRVHILCKNSDGSQWCCCGAGARTAGCCWPGWIPCCQRVASCSVTRLNARQQDWPDWRGPREA